MKKIYLLFLMITTVAQAQIINFPDANFKMHLLSANENNPIARDINNNSVKIDINNDNEIQVSEAALISALAIGNLINPNITDITGVENFVNLKNISIESPVTTLDLRGLTNLQRLNLYSIPVVHLNIEGLINLTSIDLYACNALVTPLDLRNCTNLTSIYIMRCRSLTDLNCAGLTNLTNVDVEESSLNSIDLSGATALDDFDSLPFDNSIGELNISGTSIEDFLGPTENNILIASNCLQLTRISIKTNNLTVSNCPLLGTLSARNVPGTFNITGTPNLHSIQLNNFQQSTLDVSNLHQLQELQCNCDNLEYLNLKNGTSEVVRLPDTLQSLRYICVDPEEEFTIRSTGTIPNNATLTTYCTFLPGGDYNTISGKLIYDLDNNGCNEQDIIMPLLKANITDGTNESQSFTNATGDYHFYTQEGNFTVSPDVENPDYFIFTPQTATINFPDNNNNLSTQNFCITANGIHPDVEIVITPILAARPGFDATYKIVYKNKGNQSVSGNLSLAFDEIHMDFIDSSVFPFSHDPGLLTYSYANLLPFESREILITMNINTPVETDPVNINDVLVFTASVPVASDDMPEDNTFVLNQVVVGSYDPNDITCLQGEQVAPDHIGKYLHYIINFENTGTADAENIVVKDSINAAQFDIHSLQILNSSHPMDVKVKGNVIEFIFEGINLRPSRSYPIGGHGNVLFKIKSKAELQAGSFVETMADIYFDYNAPIATNDAKTTFEILSRQVFEQDKSIKIFPNPAVDFVKIQSKHTFKSIELFDVQGRILQTSMENKKETAVDLSKQSKGIYFLKIITEKGSKIEKIIKE